MTYLLGFDPENRNAFHLDEAVMEEETESCRYCDERLFKFGLNHTSNYAFHIGADIGVVVLSELGGCEVGEDTYSKRKRPHGYAEKMESSHFQGNADRKRMRMQRGAGDVNGSE